MRLDARRGDRGYRCYDAKLMRFVPGVVWVDDVSAEWAGFVYPRIVTPSGYRLTETHKEDRITIYLDRKFVVFNEIDDAAAVDETTAQHVPAPHVETTPA